MYLLLVNCILASSSFYLLIEWWKGAALVPAKPNISLFQSLKNVGLRI